jgi:hypothetical protein
MNMRVRIAALAVALMTAALSGAVHVPTASAASCSDSWIGGSGNWSDTSHWSTGQLPSNLDSVCITAPGTYTVTGGGSAATLTVGGSSGTQTLALDGDQLGIGAGGADGSTITKHGVVVIGPGEPGNAWDVFGSTGATTTNLGTIIFPAGGLPGTERALAGNVLNQGVVQANNVNSSFTSSGTFDNQGQLVIGDGGGFTISSNNGNFINDTGGTITTAGSGQLLDHATLTQGAGTNTGNPLVSDNASIVYAGSGASSILAVAEGALSGNIAAGQSLTIEGTSSYGLGQRSVSASFTNAGTLTLADDGAGNGAYLGEYTAGWTLTNTGTLDSAAGTATHSLGLDLVNQGALSVDATLTSAHLVANDAGGTIASTGSAQLWLQQGSYTQDAGTTSGNPVLVSRGVLAYTGSGASQVVVEGANSLGGNIAAGQSLTIKDVGGSAGATAQASFTNAGTITIADDGVSGGWASLDGPAGVTLTNTGTVRSAAGDAEHDLGLSLVNQGTLAIDATTQVQNSDVTLTNQGQVTIANGATLTTFNSSTISNASGTITTSGTGAVVLGSGTYNQGAGRVVGNPVVLQNANVRYSGAGASTVIAYGGSQLQATKTISASQTLTIAADCTKGFADFRIVGSPKNKLTSKGTINLVPAPACNDSATLDASGATITNSGVLHVAAGPAIFEGALRNSKTLALDAGAQLTFFNSASYTETSKSLLQTTIASPTSYGQVVMSNSPAVLAGTVEADAAPGFTPTAGQTYTIVTATRGGVSGQWVATRGGTGALQYARTYTPTTAGLVVRAAAASLTPSSGHAASQTQLAASGFTAGEQVQVTFTDHAHTVTTLATLTADVNGQVARALTIPAGAVLGAGNLTATGATSGVSVSQTFTVN